MSERERTLLGTIVDAIPHLSEFRKGYVMGVCEAMCDKKERGEKDGKERTE